MEAAFIPEVNDELDTQNFEKFEELDNGARLLECIRWKLQLRSCLQIWSLSSGLLTNAYRCPTCWDFSIRSIRKYLFQDSQPIIYSRLFDQLRPCSHLLERA
uniref:Uncharacterized protein n=1 Tax=Arundo donax TaxID=35708 RepID=A0A0A8ZYU5_ARUDO